MLGTQFLSHTASMVIFTFNNELLCEGLAPARIDLENPKWNISNTIVQYELDRQIVFLFF